MDNKEFRNVASQEQAFVQSAIASAYSDHPSSLKGDAVTVRAVMNPAISKFSFSRYIQQARAGSRSNNQRSRLQNCASLSFQGKNALPEVNMGNRSIQKLRAEVFSLLLHAQGQFYSTNLLR